MQPTYVPDNERLPDARVEIIGPPEGMEGSVDQVPAMVDEVELAGCPAYRFSIRFAPSAMDRELIRQGHPVWVQLVSGIVPFGVKVGSSQANNGYGPHLDQPSPNGSASDGDGDDGYGDSGDIP